jgi:hypothetical protein
MEHIVAIEVICGTHEEAHWAQWLRPYGGVDFDQGYFVVERAVEPDSDYIRQHTRAGVVSAVAERCSPATWRGNPPTMLSCSRVAKMIAKRHGNLLHRD